MLVELLAGLWAPDGTILAPGFQEAVRPLTESERQATAAMPAVEAELQNLWDGIEVFAQLFARLGPAW